MADTSVCQLAGVSATLPWRPSLSSPPWVKSLSPGHPSCSVHHPHTFLYPDHGPHLSQVLGAHPTSVILSFLVSGPLKGFFLCGLYLSFTILEIKLEKFKQIFPSPSKYVVIIYCVSSGKLHCTLMRESKRDRQITPSYHCKNNFHLAIPLNGSWRLLGSSDHTLELLLW